MIWLAVIGVLLVLGGIGGLFLAEEGKIGAGIAIILGVVGLIFSSSYTQSAGEASVLVNQTGTVASQNDEPGFHAKAPWQNRNVWNTRSQSVTFAGQGDSTPDYSGGTVNGQEITSSVKGGAQANVDVQVVYSLTGDNVMDLYTEYRSQEQFTSQIIVPNILSVIRDTPSTATPVEFRGEKRAEIQTTMLERLNERLTDYGVEVVQVTIQDIRFTETVEDAIRAVEVAQQKEAEAEANLRATEVSAQAQVVEAQAEADANALRAGSLTPELIEANRVEALRVAAENGSLIIVPDGSSPLIQTPAPAPATQE